MATKTKRWAVRDEDTPLTYWLCSGAKPQRRDDGNSDLTGLCYCLAADSYEMFFPKRYHLKPGGGPVLIRFADEE